MDGGKKNHDFYPLQMPLGRWNHDGWDRLDVWHAWGRREIHTEFWRGNNKEGNRLEDLMQGIIIYKMGLKIKWDFVDWNDLAQDRDT